jgi:hypothetical protein
LAGKRKSVSNENGEKEKEKWAYLNEVEQLDHDRRYSSEETGPTRSLHNLLQPLNLQERPSLLRHLRRNARGIQRLDWRKKERRNSSGGRRGGGKGSDVGFEGAGVGREVFVRGELGGVDEDGDDGVVGFSEGRVD